MDRIDEIIKLWYISFNPEMATKFFSIFQNKKILNYHLVIYEIRKWIILKIYCAGSYRKIKSYIFYIVGIYKYNIYDLYCMLFTWFYLLYILLHFQKYMFHIKKKKIKINIILFYILFICLCISYTCNMYFLVFMLV